MIAHAAFTTLRSFWRATLPALRADAPLYLAIAAYALAALAFLEMTGAQGSAAFDLYFDRWAVRLLLILPLAALAMDYLVQLHLNGGQRRRALRRALSAKRVGRLAAGTALLMGLILFQGAFTSVKNGLSVWRGGFPHDRIQADIDAWLHFGIDPWRIGFEQLRGDAFLTIVEWNYGVAWFLLCFGVLVLVAISPRADAVRLQYTSAFMLVWALIGNVFAGLFMSAGPAFYGAVVGDEARFAELLAYLGDHGGGSAFYQDYLWRLHEEGATGFGSGISAFPSIHVSLVALNAMFAWRLDRRLGIAAWAYVAFVQFSSVHLAWHYAIDGYAGIALTAMIFLAVTRAFPAASGQTAGLQRPEPQDQAPAFALRDGRAT